MSVTPSNAQNFEIRPDEGRVVIKIDFQSREATLVDHKVFNPSFDQTVFHSTHQSQTGDAIIMLPSPGGSYVGHHKSSQYSTTGEEGSTYMIVEKIYQEGNNQRFIQFDISGTCGNTAAIDTTVVHFL